MVDLIHWPYDLLKPATTRIVSNPSSRSGGRTLGGTQRSMRTDRGFWRITLESVGLRSAAMRRTWGAIDTALSGMSGLVVVPAWSHDVAPYAEPDCNRVPDLVETTHDDGTDFDDGSAYAQGLIDIEMAAFAPVGSTVATIRIIAGAPNPAGIRFSYQHALYRTGRVLQEMAADTWRVELSTAVRMPIPVGAKLEADRPTCLCHLSRDDGMSLDFSGFVPDTATVEFVEAVDFWNDLAMGRVA